MPTNIKRSIMWRVAFGMAVVLLFAFYIVLQMFKIQFVEGSEWLSKSDSLTIVKQDISPARGNVYSDDGSLLATSMPIYEIRWDATIVSDDTFNAYVSDLSIAMSEMFTSNSAAYYRSSLRKARADGNRYKLIGRKVNYHQQKAMRSWPIFKKGRYKGGFISELSTKRVRPAGQLAFRTVGYSTVNNPGVGLERSYDSDLGGVKGKRLAQRISGGYRPINDENLKEPQNGRDVHTTINIDFQEIAQRSLSAALSAHKADHGCVVVMEVNTGKIKAITNLKSDGDGGYSERYNYSIGESYEPGSVWKVFSAMAAFEDGYVKPHDTVDLYNGYREYFNKPMRDSDMGKYKKASFVDAFARSSNVAFSSLIFDNYASDPNKYISHLKRLELDVPTGIEILGEPKPILNHPKSNTWSNLTLPWLAIGYENQHTALQLLTAYNAIINDGSLVPPIIVEQVTDAGEVVRNIEGEVTAKKVCSKKTSEYIKHLTAAVFEKGSARRVKSNIVALAGKTGTAQIASKSGYQTIKKYNASFVGHFPAYKPVYSIYVMVNRPTNGFFYSSSVAAPVFKEVAEKIFTISVKDEIKPKEGKQSPHYLAGTYSDLKSLNKYLGVQLNVESSSELVSINAQDKKIVPVVPTPGKMPNVINMGARDAVYVLEKHGLKPIVTGYGRVIEQSPVPDVSVSKNRRVYIRLN